MVIGDLARVVWASLTAAKGVVHTSQWVSWASATLYQACTVRAG
jgi:hypothetical protein